LLSCVGIAKEVGQFRIRTSETSTVPDCRRTQSAIAIVLLLGWLLNSAKLLANELACGCQDGACACLRRSESNGWKVIESASFRIHHIGDAVTAERLAKVCERLRQSLRERWIGDTANIRWTPKCDLILYPTANDFQRLTRQPAERLGFADLEIGDGQVWMRRLHVRADDLQRLDKLLVHELTHVVLADHFAQRQIPRWADEGIAVLSEPVTRRNEWRRWLRDEAAQGRLFPLRDLANLRQIPRDKRLGDLFYAQSAALVEYLLSERKLSESQVLQLVSDSESQGLDRTLERWFPEESFVALETDWQLWLATNSELLPLPVTSR
jgi:hypothetical protein